MGDLPRDAGLPPGYDEANPYEDENLSTYPDWWRRNVEEFRAQGMRPYRPPRLADGTVLPPFLADLSERYEVDVYFHVVDPQAGGEWSLVADGDPVASAEHERTGEGYTVYHLGSNEVERLVREAASE
jgi:hypothetical protein